MAKKTIDQIDVTSKRVLMRVDFNVPVDESGNVTDDSRIHATLPSIKAVIERKGQLILVSHFGRPDGKGYEPEFTLKPAADRLKELLPNVNITFVEKDCIGPDAAKAVESLSDGEIVILENLRFHKGEKDGDATFAAKLAAFGNIYCNEAFGAAHRNDASMLAVPQAMEGKPRVAGIALRRELKYLSDTINNPERPFVAVLGGAKVSDKLGAIHNLINKVDTVLIGGAMAYTFLKALRREIGTSMVQLGMLKQAEKTLDEAAASETDLILPQDHVCGKQITHMTPVRVFEEDIEDGWMGLDIGPDTTSHYAEILERAKTVIWNGPMGVFETAPFDVGTKRVAEAITRATSKGAVSVVGGGDSVAAVQKFGLTDKFSHVSTGGGASLQMLEGRAFDTVAVLDDA